MGDVINFGHIVRDNGARRLPAGSATPRTEMMLGSSQRRDDCEIDDGAISSDRPSREPAEYVTTEERPNRRRRCT